MIRAWIAGGTETIERIRLVSPAIKRAMLPTMNRLAVKLQRKVKDEKLNGQVLHRRTRVLAWSIYQDVLDRGDMITGIVGTPIKYGKLHEYGGTVTVKEHMRRSRSGEYHRVRQHSATYPERSFLRSSLAEMLPTIRSELRSALTTATRTAMKK